MLDTGIAWQVVTARGVLSILLITAVVAWPLGRLLGRGARGVVFVVILGAVLAATTTTPEPYFSLGGVIRYLHAWTYVNPFEGFAGDDERLANIGLFAPLALAATLIWRRPVVIVAAGALLSFTIEAWQGFIGRSGDPVDVVHNTAGALLGVLIGLALTSLEEVRRRQQPARVDHR